MGTRNIDPETHSATRRHYIKLLWQTRRQLIWVWIRNRLATIMGTVLIIIISMSGFFAMGPPKGEPGFFYMLIGIGIMWFVIWLITTHPSLNRFAKRWERQETTLRKESATIADIVRSLKRSSNI